MKITINKNNLKNLNLDPLSIAKFFYEKGADDSAIIQRLIYLNYLEILKKENILLFDEEWQAWSGGPIVESVFHAMNKHWEKHKNYRRFFAKIPPIKQKNVLFYLEKIYQDYQIYAQNKNEFLLFEATRSMPWKLARRNLTDELDHEKIELGDILTYIKSERKNLEL